MSADLEAAEQTGKALCMTTPTPTPSERFSVRPRTGSTVEPSPFIPPAVEIIRALITELEAREAKEPSGWRPITMADVRLCAGEGKLDASTVLQACNAIAARRYPTPPEGGVK